MELRSHPNASRRGGPAATLAASAGLLCLGIASPALAIDRSWNAGNGYWGTGGNWSPIGVPGPADTARLGDLGGISNGFVTLDINEAISALEITDGMSLRTGTHSLAISTVTEVRGQNVDGPDTFPSTLRIQKGGAFVDFLTGHLTIAEGGRFLVDGGARARIDGSGSASDHGVLGGRGIVEFTGNFGDAFDNQGLIHASAGGLSLQALGTARIDLDGSDGSGAVLVDTRDGTSLTVSDDALADLFSGEIHITSNSRLLMQLSDGWTADPASSITVESLLAQDQLPPARISGGDVTLAGAVEVGGFSGHLLVNADAILKPTAEVLIGYGDRAQFTGQTTINSASFILSEGADLDFDGPTVVEDGTFTTFGIEDGDGDVNFNGPTTWAGGEVNIDGRARQSGDATVDAATMINATLFDIRGQSGQTNWDINHSLTINADHVMPQGLDLFQGQIDIGGSLLARLVVNLDGEDQIAWTMAGVMNLAGQPGDFFVTRLAGSIVYGLGEFNIDHNVQIDASLYMRPGGSLNFQSADAQLRTHGRTILRENTVFSGQGTLRNGNPGEMTLYHGLSLGQVGLINQGILTFWRADHPELGVLATVDRFTNEDSGTLRIRLGGHDLGETYDHLLITGAATLDGHINVALLDNAFAPQIGDEFTILTAAGGIAGTFANKASTTVGPYTYKWTILYGANSVTLRLADIEGCSADLAETFGVLDLFDFLAFVNYFNAGDAIADRDHNGILDLFDFLLYVNEFNAGC
jgi:hypothetical protein